MIKVNIEGEHYIVALPKITLVMTRVEFLSALRCGKSWRRRKVQAAREAEAAVIADGKRGKLA